MTGIAYPTLPQGHQRFTVEQLLIDLAPELGLRAGALHALLHMMKRTSPGDWTSPSKEPVFFAPQDETARALGKTRRALYNTEAQLERLGLVEKRVKGNGARSPFGGCGIVFSKLIDLVPSLLEFHEQLKRERAERKALKNRRSTYVRHVKRSLRELDDTPSRGLQFIIEQFDRWPVAEHLHRLDIDALAAHVDQAQRLCEELDEMISNRRDSSGEPAQNFTCFIQENNKESSSVTCNASNGKRSVDKSTHSGESCSSANADEVCLENRHAAESEALKTQFLSRLNPERLFSLASDEMQALIIECQGPAPVLRELHFVDAATRMLPILGVNHSAWLKAIQVMGDAAATMCILLLDANRTHPTAPVRNVGGALRAMTDRARSGKLNLVGSLIGLSRRRGM